MRYLYATILIVFAVTAFYYATRIFYNKNYKKITFQIFSIASVASGIWSAGFGLKYVFEDEVLFSIARAVGLLGVLLFIIAGQIIMAMVSEKTKYIPLVTIPELIVGILVLRSISIPGSYNVNYTRNYGYVTGFKTAGSAAIFICFFAIIAIIFSSFAVNMILQKDNHKMNAMGKAFLKISIIISIGMIIDVVGPLFGVNFNIPVSAILQYGALLILQRAVGNFNRNVISKDNVSEYFFKVMKVPVIFFDKKHKAVLANDVALKYMGNPTDAQLEKIDVWREFFDREAPELIIKTTDVDTITMDVEVEKLDTFCRISMDPIFNEFGDYIGYIMVVSDLSDHMEKIRLEEATNMKTAFLANMSHEIRTPLNAIIGFNDAILQNTNNSQKVLGYAQNISEAGENLKGIINSILDISKIEMGQLDIDSKEYSTITLLDNLSSMFEMLAKRKGLDFYTEIDPTLPEVLIGDEAHLRQILTNILGNAVKYTDKGSVTLKVKVLYKEDGNPSQKILFSVTDTGRGIRKEDRNKLFEKFQRLDTEHFKHTEGTGLGMSIVLFTLRAMGSDIQFDSEYGKGSKFYFVLDQVALNQDMIGDFQKRRAQNAIKEVKSINFRAPEAKVLIVDDVEMNIDAACALLEYTQMQIDRALSGKQALEMIRNKKYDIIFMDHMMPEMDGIETAQKIRELSVECKDAYYAMVPIIALTANALVGVRELYMNAGMQDFVSKPIEVRTIISVLRKWLPADLVLDVDDSIATDSTSVNVEADDWGIEIPGIDVQEAMNYTLNKAGFEKNMKTFIKVYSNSRKELSDLFEASDVAGYVIKVHGLKSTSKMIGAMELSAAALDMEKKGKEGILLAEDFSNLMELYDTCIHNLKGYFGIEEESQSGDYISEEEYQALLGKIKEAADSFDAGAFMMMDEELENTKVAPNHKEEYDKLVTWVSTLSFGDISEYLS